MNVAFKHLEAKLRFGELSIGQWASVLAGVLVGLLVAQYASPFGGVWGLVIGVYVGAIPACAALFASLSEFDLWGLLAAAVRWRRAPGRYLPGPGENARGYVLRADAHSPTNDDREEIALDALFELADRAAPGATR
ncbi:MAG TPA: hypothetical protein VFZ00_12965 [Solirubrobacter sp.]|nr:hypothetical protein [Solirubrobacter sp.]